MQKGNMTPAQFADYFANGNYRSIQDRKAIVTTKELKAIREEYNFNGEFRLFLCGELWDIKSKNLGLGQYQIWLQAAEV